MKVAEVIQRRQDSWKELEQLCDVIGRTTGSPGREQVKRFSALYRAACADLALAEAYQLPPNTVDYLHRLVARAHNQLYRSRGFHWQYWYQRIFVETPRKVFQDPCVHLCTVLFWGLFLLSAFLAYDNTLWPGFAEKVVGQDELSNMEQMYQGFDEGRGIGGDGYMFGMYVYHNASIGLSCFVTMLVFLLGMVTLVFNAVQLGTVFGFMFRPELGDASLNFQNFVTAHGPFELTAIILSAGAGLKIGISWIKTNGMRRRDSLALAGRGALPIALTAMILFCLAAVLEGFVSATPSDQLPWVFKGMVAVVCNCTLLVYFVVLGYPRKTEVEESAYEI